MKEFKYTIDGKEYKVQIDGVEGNIASVNVNGEAYKVEMEQEAEPEKKKVVLGQPAAASDDAEATPAANVNTANAVKAPLPGTITSIEVAVGQEVKAGDTVVVLEAMKMQNNIEAEKDGKVTAICVKPGQAVLEEDALVLSSNLRIILPGSGIYDSGIYKEYQRSQATIVCDLFLYCCMSINCYTKYFFTKEKRHKVQ